MQPTVLKGSSSCHPVHTASILASSHSVSAAWPSSAHACGFKDVDSRAQGRVHVRVHVPCSACRAACNRMFSTCVMALPVLSNRREWSPTAATAAQSKRIPSSWIFSSVKYCRSLGITFLTRQPEVRYWYSMQSQVSQVSVVVRTRQQFGSGSWSMPEGDGVQATQSSRHWSRLAAFAAQLPYHTVRLPTSCV